MATPDLVPRANNEGGIGVSGLNWGSGYFNTLFRGGSAVYAQADAADAADVAASTPHKVVTAPLLKSQLDAISVGDIVNSITDGLGATLTGTVTLAELDGIGVSIDGHTHVFADIPGSTNVDLLTGPSASNEKVPSQLAVKTYVDTQIAGISANSLAGLSDTNVGGVSDNQVLSYDQGSSKWIAVTLSTTTLEGLTDTDISGPVAGSVLGWDTNSSKWTEVDNNDHNHTISQITSLEATLQGKAAVSHTHSIAQVTNLQAALDTIPTNLDDLADVQAASPVVGQALVWTSGGGGGSDHWAPASVSGGSASAVRFTDGGTQDAVDGTVTRDDIDITQSHVPLYSLHLGIDSDAVFKTVSAEGYYSLNGTFKLASDTGVDGYDVLRIGEPVSELNAGEGQVVIVRDDTFGTPQSYMLHARARNVANNDWGTNLELSANEDWSYLRLYKDTSYNSVFIGSAQNYNDTTGRLDGTTGSAQSSELLGLQVYDVSGGLQRITTVDPYGVKFSRVGTNNQLGVIRQVDDRLSLEASDASNHNVVRSQLALYDGMDTAKPTELSNHEDGWLLIKNTMVDVSGNIGTDNCSLLLSSKPVAYKSSPPSAQDYAEALYARFGSFGENTGVFTVNTDENFGIIESRLVYGDGQNEPTQYVYSHAGPSHAFIKLGNFYENDIDSFNNKKTSVFLSSSGAGSNTQSSGVPSNGGTKFRDNFTGLRAYEPATSNDAQGSQVDTYGVKVFKQNGASNFNFGVLTADDTKVTLFSATEANMRDGIISSALELVTGIGDAKLYAPGRIHLLSDQVLVGNKVVFGADADHDFLKGVNPLAEDDLDAEEDLDHADLAMLTRVVSRIVRCLKLDVVPS
jgi:hypothetical protein